MNEERLKLVEQQVSVLRNDMQSAISQMLADLAQTLQRMAGNIARDIETLEKRVSVIEGKVPYNEKYPKGEGGKEL